MLLIITGCSVRAANANASRKLLAAWVTDSLTWFDKLIGIQDVDT
jgi:hypothetical protein